MRKSIGSICYVLGGAAGVLALQLLIGCELLSAFSKFENQRYDFWGFLCLLLTATTSPIRMATLFISCETYPSWVSRLSLSG